MSIEEKIDARLDKIETLLAALVERQQVKEWYTTTEAARLLGKAEFTVREWARLGRIRAEKRVSGRGAFPAWVISHDEILRYQREGLIPFAPVTTRIG
jgi:excisionase family DNA binding protein